MKQIADLRLKSAFIVELTYMEKEADHVVKRMGIGNTSEEQYDFRLVLLWLFKNGLLRRKRLRS